MKNEYIIIVATLAIFVVYYFFGNIYSPITNYPPKNNIIVAFGDSLIAGHGSTEGNDFISLLSKKIKKPIVNLGFIGNTAGEGLTRISDVTNRNPGTVIVLFGGNDYLRNISTDETIGNLRNIISILQLNRSFVILLGVRGGVINDNYRLAFDKLARETGVVYVPDVLSPVFGRPEYMYDFVHPNDSGYEKVFEKVYLGVGKYFW